MVWCCGVLFQGMVGLVVVRCEMGGGEKDEREKKWEVGSRSRSRPCQML